MKKLNTLLLVILIINLGQFIYNNRQAYLTPYDIDYWQKEFSVSQVVMGGKAKHEFSDSELYSILGYKYIKGQDPTALHPEVPPLGKQLIGLSIVLFRNQNIINLILGLLELGVLYLISLKLFPNSTLPILVIILESMDSEFRYLLTTANLDTSQLLAFSLSIYFFIRGLKSRNWFYLSALCLGLSMTIKFYFNGLLLLSILQVVLVLNKRFYSFISFNKSLLLTVVGYFIPYLPRFAHDPSLISFLKFQRWLTGWWAGNAQAPWGGGIRMIATGWWRTWWPGPEFIRVSEWNILWPSITLLGVLAIVFIALRKDILALLIWLWVGTYLIFISMTSAFPRYFLLVSPFLSMLTIYFFWSFSQSIRKNFFKS